MDRSSVWLLCLVLIIAGDGSSQSLDISPPSDTTFDCAQSKQQFVTGAAGRVKIFPWMALLGSEDSEVPEWYCLGALINEQWVLSAAQCFLNVSPRLVRFGEYDYNDDNDGAPHHDYQVADVILHPDYIPPENSHDLALVRLNTKVTIQRYISPVCLPWGTESYTDMAGQKATVASFRNYDFSTKTSLEEVQVPVFPTARCDSSYSSIPKFKNQTIGEEIVCAGGPDGDACRGDSGGPLVSQDARGRYIAGAIVSGGIGCRREEFPGLYVNLRHASNLAWIKEVAFSQASKLSSPIIFPVK